ncbi:MAG: YbaB/EbfC family nucleoid-associated protein [Deltaproteobacteria bacterium]|nr:YbaB/EbfC family nucleoid-associated protein [Deltaproteobacteria bacterium]
MDGFDMNGLMGMMGGLQQRMADLQRAAAETVVEGSAAGGLVKIQVTGDQQVVSVRIDQDALEDRELLEDLVRAAMDEALRRSKEVMAQSLREATGGLPIPPGMIPGF